MRRREFLGPSVAAAFGFSLSPRRGWPQETPAEKKNEPGAPTASFDSLIPRVAREIPRLLEENSVPGLAIVLIRNGKVGWHLAFGIKDASSMKPVEDGTGVLNLDTPLTRYTPERYLEGDPRLDLITARHVLSHTSGFQNW